MRINRNNFWRTVLILGVFLATSPGYAWNYWGIDWNYLGGNPVAVDMKVNPNCADPTAPDELAALTSAMNSWSTAGANFVYNYAGSTSITNYTFNGQNEMCWNPGTSGGALATTSAWYQPGTSNMTECDVVFWDGNTTWNTSWPSLFQFDVESVALHELGHCLGLDHSQYNWAVMWPSISWGEVQRDLSSDDIEGVIWIYGSYSGADLSVSLTPTGTLFIPSAGGSLPYDLEVVNLAGTTVYFSGWSEFEGYTYGYTQIVINRPDIYIGAGVTVSRSGTLTISGSVPDDTYDYYLRVGDYVGTPNPIDEDSFIFWKYNFDANAPYVWETTDTGWDDMISSQPVIPESFQVKDAYPNPFNPETTIAFDLPEATHLTLTVYNLQGQKVVDLVSGDFEAGHYKARWNATGHPSGTYIYQFSSDLGQASGKMVLVK